MATQLIITLGDNGDENLEEIASSLDKVISNLSRNKELLLIKPFKNMAFTVKIDL